MGDVIPNKSGKRKGAGNRAGLAAAEMDERMARDEASRKHHGGAGMDTGGMTSMLGEIHGDVFDGDGEYGASEDDCSARRMVYTPSYSAQVLLGSARAEWEFRCIRGPIGNGKSVACCWFIYFCGRLQVAQPVVEDGRRRMVRWSKFLIARHTFKALDETTVETWNQWFGDRTRWTTNPYQGRFEEVVEDGTLVRIDFVCYATESRNIMNDLQSLELSGAWINEAVQTPWPVVGRAYTRLKRFNPVPRNKVRLRRFGILMDTNSPDETNWWRRKEVEERPPKWLFIVCPPALIRTKGEQGRARYVPNDLEHCHLRGPGKHPAENVNGIDGGYHEDMSYWMDMVHALDEDDIRKLLLNEYGTSVAGMPVFPEWRHETHVRRGAFEMKRGMTLVCGMDLGRRPALVVGQMGADGVLRVMDEVTTWDAKMNSGRGGLQSVDVVQFYEEWVRPKLVNEYDFPRCRHVVFADPAGKNFTETSSISAIDLLRGKGLNVVACDKIPCSSGESADIANANDVDIRLRCVSAALRNTRYGEPELQVSDRCSMLVQGMGGKYCFRKMRALGGDGAERYDDKPDKNDFSHVCDALQYLCLGVFKGATDYSRPSGEAFGGGAEAFGEASFDLGIV